ncbi:hypothetical protein M2302_002247 [Micromonospora sp. A200]|uniref:hypothetical protein n=1 Tax=Micromonospora sp. A200 TaxID=2940568 RepID=UPI0024738D3E|nr:hypothetical protein [Micromonospora sp. A200]MDH6462072.1 hypothetical protein [Micromonospora sp. A200]
MTLEQLVEHIDAMILKAEDELAMYRREDRKLMIPACEFQLELLRKTLDVDPGVETTSRRARRLIENLQGKIEKATADGDMVQVRISELCVLYLQQALGEKPIE